MATKRSGLADAFELPPPRPRTRVEEPAVVAFTEPESAEGSPKKRPSRLRREGPGERVNAYLPPDVVMAMREVAFRERRSLSDVLTEAAVDWARKRARAQERKTARDT